MDRPTMPAEQVAPRAHVLPLPESRRRYHLHGDLRDNGGTYYCRRCDDFVPPSHFVPGDEEDLRRFRDQIRRGHDRPSNSYRPKAANESNLFRASLARGFRFPRRIACQRFDAHQASNAKHSGHG